MDVYIRFKRDLFVLVITVLLVNWGWGYFPLGIDSTDSGNRRSGMALRIDNLTGCHYLEGTAGGIIKRDDKDGAHICTGQESK